MIGCLGNILWFIFCGFWQGLGWLAAGVLWCVTIVGAPVGIQCFKFARLWFFPFGKEVVYGNGSVSLLLNVLWLIFGGIPLAVASAVNGVALCMTIIGIPFGLQCFKLTQLAIYPFGTRIKG